MSKPLLRNYVSISDTKGDLLYAQIPRRTFEAIAGELNFDLKLFSLKVSKSGKEDSQESRYAKTQTVLRYLEKHFAMPCRVVCTDRDETNSSIEAKNWERKADQKKTSREPDQAHSW